MMLALDNPHTLQEAVNAANDHDTIQVPAGRHGCLPVRLRSHLTLQLLPGACLTASRDIADYSPFDELKLPCSIGQAFIGGANLEDVTIDGGVFEASGDAFWTDFDGAPNPAPTASFRPRHYQPASRRPTAMLFFNCRDLTLRNFTILNSPSYTIWLIGCQRVRIENVTICNHRLSPNTDGLDIDCCQDVWIRGCDLRCGDDCIALKSHTAMLGEDRPCERIVISDCILSSPCCAFRAGYEGDGIIRDVTASNLVIYGSNKGLDFLSLIPRGKALGIRRGTRMENLLFQNIAMRDVRQPISIWSNTELPEDLTDYQGWIRRIHFSDMTIEATDASFIGGLAVSEISLQNIDLRVRRDMSLYRDAQPVTIPTVWGRGFLPNPLTIYQAPDTRLSNVNVQETRDNEM